MEARPLTRPLPEDSALPEPLPSPESIPSRNKQGLRASRVLLTGIARAVPASIRIMVFFMLIERLNRGKESESQLEKL
jgi:hypothetical protein